MTTEEKLRLIQVRLVKLSGELGDAAAEIGSLQAENARLKGRVAHLAGLVKQAEWNYNESREIECQYCGVYRVKENGDLRNQVVGARPSRRREMSNDD